VSRVLVIAEHARNELHVNTAKCVACARELGSAAVDVAVFAHEPKVAHAASTLEGVRKVLSIVDARHANPLAAVIAPQAVILAHDYTHVLAPSSTFGKDLLPRIAALLDVGQISDLMAVETPHRFRRPIYAGNAIVTVEADPARRVVASVRTASFAAVGEQPPSPVELVSVDAGTPTHTRFVELKSSDVGRIDLQTASRVVAGGRGLGSGANFELVKTLAGVLGAALGASRAAVDLGYVPNDLQVGQTGKIIAPDLYIAVGISGAIQHLTGIKDARTIVAINKDADAPIFEVADIGLVADLFDAVPELIAELGRRTTA
jgi:electron transfer flavoprotein alpha subunit